jgi:8-oxo-dGTP diphosphatase
MIDVTCAIIEMNGKILIAQRGLNTHLALKWEFPGGKVKENEQPETSIVREIEEELCIKVEPIVRLAESTFDYVNKSIRLIPFICRYKSGQLFLKVHNNYRWVKKEDLLPHDWCEADVPVVNSYLLYKR